MGYTLDQVEEETKIRKFYLKALEDENFELLPARVYAIGFVRRYARFLCLNEDEAVQWFKEMISPAEYETEDIAHKDEAKRKWKWPEVKWQTVVAAVIFLILAIWLGKIVVGYIADSIEQNRSYAPGVPVEQGEPSVVRPDSDEGAKAPETKPSSEEDRESGAGISSETSDKDAASSPGETGTAGEKVTVKLRATDRSWVSLYVDGEKAFSGIMNANEETQVSGYEVTLTVGNAGGILVTVDGKDLGYLGRSGEVIRNKVFTGGS